MENIGMENACFYTFSTICQTLAGAFGFLMAVVIYQSQSLESGLSELWNLYIRDRGWSRDSDITDAAMRGNWTDLADVLMNSTTPPGAEERAAREMVRRKDQYVALAGQLRQIKVNLRKALLPTALTVGASLFMLPLGGQIAGCKPLAWGLMFGAVIAALRCLHLYFSLARGVTE